MYKWKNNKRALSTFIISTRKYDHHIRITVNFCDEIVIFD